MACLAVGSSERSALVRFLVRMVSLEGA
jgi:hypothetical protein